MIFWPYRVSISGSQALFLGVVPTESSLESHKSALGAAMALVCEIRSFKTHLKQKYGKFKGPIGLKGIPFSH